MDAIRQKIDEAIRQASQATTPIRLLDSCYGIDTAEQSWLATYLSSDNEHVRVAALRLFVARQICSFNDAAITQELA